MPLESANFISQLTPTNPAGGDQKSQGDNHIRMIKSVLQATFPNLSFSVTFDPVLKGIVEQSSKANARAFLEVPDLNADNEFISDDAGAAVGPLLILWRDSATPADDDAIGGLLFRGNNDAAEKIDFALDYAEILDASDGTEDARRSFAAMLAGTLTDRVHIHQGLWMEGATGNDKGAGTVNAKGFFLEGEELAVPGYVAKTSGYTVVGDDENRTIDFTTAGATCAFDPAATLGSNFIFEVVNSDTSGDVTLDPDSGETLDGLATRLLRPGDRAKVLCDGTNFRTLSGRYSFESGLLAISLGNAVGGAHGLGVTPSRFGAWLRAKASPEFGYTEGDLINASALDINASTTRATSVYANDTNVFISFGSAAPGLLNLSTDAIANIDISKWEVIVWAVDEH